VTGQVENCQVSVHAGYVSSRGQALIDTELYLPEAFALDSQRCAKTGVPADRAGVVITKGDLATVMFGRAVTAGMPFGYVAGDEVYGRSATLRHAIEDTGEHGYVLEVGCDFRVSRAPGDKLRADALPVEVPRWGWEHRSQGHGSKGLRYHAWAWIALDSGDCPTGWRRSLLIRRDPDDTAAADHSDRNTKASKRKISQGRKISTMNRGGNGGKGGTRAEVQGKRGEQTAAADEQYAYFLCYHRLDTTFGELIQVAGRRWGIEESFAITKSETGLDEHQVRRWKAWYRHAILSMLAAAFLAAMRARLPANPTAWQAG
jgi:SRSO17 transposase